MLLLQFHILALREINYSKAAIYGLGNQDLTIYNSTMKNRLKVSFQILIYSFKKAPLPTLLVFVTHLLLYSLPLLVAYVFNLVLNAYNTKLNDTKGFFILLVIYITLVALQRFIALFRSIFSESILRWTLENATWFDFHKKLYNLDINYFENAAALDVISKTRQSLNFRPVLLITNLSYSLASLVVVIGSVGIMLTYGAIIPILLIISVLPKFLVGLKYSEAQWSIFDSDAESNKRLLYLSNLATDPESIKEIKIFGVSNKLMQLISNIQRGFYHKNISTSIKFTIVNLLAIIVQYVFTFLALSSYLLTNIRNPNSVGELTFFITLVFTFSENINSTLDDAIFFMEQSLYLGNFQKVLNLPSTVELPPTPIIPKFHKGTPLIELKNVSFKYRNELPYALKNISIKIEIGENVALVGENGSGKSTLIKLLLRFYDVTDGEILINGVNIKNIDLNWWYSQVGALFQHFIKYNFTVKESIAFGDSNPDLEKMKKAMKLSGLYELVETFPLKYDQYLGTQFYNGYDLSGGQWQKVALARAFYRMPKVLILDEPTSAIDANAEYEIFRNINDEYQDDKILLIVSHRFSTVRMAKKIIVLSKGTVKEIGTHEQLLNSKELYAEMFLKQAQGYK